MMKLENVKNTQRPEKMRKVLSVRATEDQFAWIKKNKISATKIFQEALKELGYKKKTK